MLIPRPDSEHVVMECLRLAKDLAAADRSSTSAPARATSPWRSPHQHKTARVTAVDLSADALAVARRNADEARRRRARRASWQAICSRRFADEQFDFIVSNPPYIPHEEIAKLSPGVRDYEPHLALDGGPDGFAVFDRLLADAGAYLKPAGYLIIEIGAPQEETARRKITARSEWELAPTVQDYSGHPRMLVARRRA